MGKSQGRRCQPAWPGPCASGPDPQRPCWPQASFSPLHTTALGRAFSHLQLGLPDVTAQGNRMSPSSSLGLVIEFSRCLMTSDP